MPLQTYVPYKRGNLRTLYFKDSRVNLLQLCCVSISSTGLGQFHRELSLLFYCFFFLDKPWLVLFRTPPLFRFVDLFKRTTSFEFRHKSRFLVSIRVCSVQSIAAALLSYLEPFENLIGVLWMWCFESPLNHTTQFTQFPQGVIIQVCGGSTTVGLNC